MQRYEQRHGGGSVPVPQRHVGTDQAFPGRTSLMVAVGSGVGREAAGRVIAALLAVLAGFQHFLSGIMGQLAMEWPSVPQ